MPISRLTAPLLLAALLGGCADDLGPASPDLESSVFTLFGGLEVGEALTLSGAAADSFFLAGAAGGAEYLYVPFFASEGGTSRLQVEVGGTRLQNVGLGALLRDQKLAPADSRWRLDEDGHARFLEKTRADVGARLSLAPSLSLSRTQASARSRSRAAAAPVVGALMPLNTASSCGGQNIRQGRVEAVSRAAIVVADTANPANGLTRGDYEEFGRQFDELVQPVLTRAFGEATDVDSNSRVIIFFTRAVNELTPPQSGSYVGGYFWAGDLFPRELCPGSNEAEVFYQLAADPTGIVNDNGFPTDFVRARSLGVIGHEYQHLINAGRRIYFNDAETLEATWLNEGLSHVAEELLFYAASGLKPGQNLDLATLRSSRTINTAVNAFQTSNLVRLSSYLEEPELQSLLGVDNLETRGATWAFLRYASDHDPRSDDEFFRRLVNTPFAGTENLTRVLGVDAVDRMQHWTLSVFTDDHVVTADSLHQQPSWNFRSIIPVFYASQRFPLRVHAMTADEPVQLRLYGGGAAFVRLRGAGSRPTLLSTTSGGRTPPDRLRVSVLRLR